MSAIDWQYELRRQYGREQTFVWRNLGDEPIFSVFLVQNLESRRHYRVAIRGNQRGDNFCSCPDFATNELGACKHIEFMLAQLEQHPQAGRAFSQSFQAPYSEIYLRYGIGERAIQSPPTHADRVSSRGIYFCAGTECPSDIKQMAAQLMSQNAHGSLLDDSILADPENQRLEKLLARCAKKNHELRFYDDARQYVASQHDAARRKNELD